MAQKLNLLTKNVGHFTNEIKKIVVVYPTLFKEKYMNGSQRIVHIVYVRRTYKTLDFCKLPALK